MVPFTGVPVSRPHDITGTIEVLVQLPSVTVGVASGSFVVNFGSQTNDQTSTAVFSGDHSGPASAACIGEQPFEEV